jgi:osmotically-inducible protein OsmY
MMRSIKLVAIAAVLMTLTPAVFAAVPETTDLTPKFLAAGASVENLQVSEIAGIVIIRGRAADKDQAAILNLFAQNLGYQRVANLVQITKNDDAQIARNAERLLTVHHALDGCRFSVRSVQGVLHVAGRVRHELQKDVAFQVLRSINGVRSVDVQLDRF